MVRGIHLHVIVSIYCVYVRLSVETMKSRCVKSNNSQEVNLPCEIHITVHTSVRPVSFPPSLSLIDPCLPML